MPMSAMRSLVSAACLSMLLLSLAMAQPAAPGEAQPVALRPDWQVGQTSRYEFWTLRNQTVTISAQGRSRSLGSSVESKGEVTWTVDKVNPDGSSVGTMTLDWMTAALTNHQTGKSVNNDSRKPTGDSAPIHDLLKAMSGVPITVYVAADGSITKVTGVDAMRRKAKAPDMVPEELDFMESANDLAAIPFAPAQAMPGASWQAKLRWTHDLGHIQHDITYKLAGLEDIDGVPVATVEGKGKLKLEVDRSEIPKDGPSVNVRLVSGSLAQQVIFDLSRHEAVGRNSREKRTINVELRFPQGVLTRRIEEDIQSQVLRIEEKQ